jgi:xylulokinase
MARLLGIDVGTSGCKLVLIDETGKVLKQASREYPISTPRPLWSEQNPLDWWEGVRSCLAEMGETSPDAIGVTGQMHGAVFLDAHDEVIRPAILWNDQRTVAECEEIDRTAGAENVRRVTCNPPLTGFQLPKILWLRNNELDRFRQLESVLLPKDYIRFRLSGVKATEVSDASGVGLFDVPKRRWSSELAEALGLRESLFPECFESSQVSARTRGVPGLADGIPIVGGGGDQAAAAVGTGCVEPGIVSVSLGTSGVVFTALTEPAYHAQGAAHTFCHANNAWHAMGVMLSCGGAVRWFRDTLAAGKSYDEMTSAASRAPVGCGGVTFLPYLTGERCPHIDPYARAAFGGMTLSTTFEHLCRSLFEGVTFGLKEGFDLLAVLGATASQVRVNGGGAKSSFWVQLISDVFQAGCAAPSVDEGPAFGAAILAGVGVGVWPSVQQGCREVVKLERFWEPQAVDYSGIINRYKELYTSIGGWNHLIGS